MSEAPPRRYAFSHRHAVAWGDMDALGHVNNVAYARYFEIVRAEFFRSTQLGFRADQNQDVMLVMSGLQLRYRSQVIWPAVLELTLQPSQIGSRTLHLVCSMWDQEDRCVCEGRSDHIWVHRDSGRPARLPLSFAPLAEQFRKELQDAG
ncbi:MAG: acyl-CoA thioesterase [Leptospirales bacterium]|nr:acyl-CoA thioesterase [Leptospirales bacterium]